MGLLYFVFIGHQTVIFKLFEDIIISNAKNIVKKEKNLVCGDWNLNFMVENKRTQGVENLLESYNLTNIVRLPKRINPASKPLIDVVIINKRY
jgi:uncharacterized protein YbcI